MCLYVLRYMAAWCVVILFFSSFIRVVLYLLFVPSVLWLTTHKLIELEKERNCLCACSFTLSLAHSLARRFPFSNILINVFSLCAHNDVCLYYQLKSSLLYFDGKVKYEPWIRSVHSTPGECAWNCLHLVNMISMGQTSERTSDTNECALVLSNIQSAVLWIDIIFQQYKHNSMALIERVREICSIQEHVFR